MDLEMTGLDPDRDVIVEIATIVTDDELQVVAEGPDLIIHQPDDVLARMSGVVREMHEKSGLLPAIRTSATTLEEAGAATLEFIRSHVPSARSVPLCGNSIGTDRRFLARHLPAIEDYLHYRCVDVSTIKELARRWYPSIDRPRKTGTHRALDDVRASIEELRFYRGTVFSSADGNAAPAPVDAAAEDAQHG
jgi:oligoribonuclease